MLQKKQLNKLIDKRFQFQIGCIFCLLLSSYASYNPGLHLISKIILTNLIEKILGFMDVYETKV